MLSSTINCAMNALMPAHTMIYSYCNVKEKFGQFCQKQTELANTDHKTKIRGSGQRIGLSSCNCQACLGERCSQISGIGTKLQE